MANTHIKFKFLISKLSIREYHNKRNFTKTPEPPGNTGQQENKREQRTWNGLRFVVQKHDATRLHYDFRLETKDGGLKSWAVPKGFSFDPKLKRLAVMTEDHPLDYLLFEGTIPQGNYGAGTVIVWDTGSYTTDEELSDQLQNGKVIITLFGQKLKGRFLLIRRKTKELKDNQWLLIKGNDQYASDEDVTLTRPDSVLTVRTNEDLVRKEVEESDHKQLKQQKDLIEINLDTKTDELEKRKQIKPSHQARFPYTIKPMQGTLVDVPFDSTEWVFEVKWDGVRAILFINKVEHIVELRSRNDKSITHRYPELLSTLKSAISCKESAILDGEIVVLNEKGFPDFQKHQRRMNVDYSKDIERLAKEFPSTYYFFDILYLDGKNLQSLSFADRRQILSSVVIPNDRIKISDFIEKKGIDTFRKLRDFNIEGMMAKKKSGQYIQGERSADWLKIKNVQTQDCIVIGYTRGEGNRQGYFGSLLLTVYDEKGELVFVGHTGSGFDFNLLDKLYRRLEKMKIESCPIRYVPYTNREPVWVRPELVVEVKFHGWTNDRIMRAPIFLRIREDKSPSECRIELKEHIIKDVQDAQYADATNYRPSYTQQSTYDNNTQSDNKQSFSNLDKIFWIKTKYSRALTKRDLIDYYGSISEYILPHLKDRPLSLSRYPDGILGKHFYHKNWDKEKPEYVETVKVHSENSGAIVNYIVCNNKDTLLWLANLGCIEMHPWYSRITDFDSCKDRELDEDKCGLNFPDFIVFDLDPYIYSGQETAREEPEYNINAFKAVVEVAFHMNDLFKQLNISSYVKTSGKTGLHVFVPIISSYTYDQTRSFAKVIGNTLVKKHTNKITTEWKTANRKGKVFFDYNQNSKGKTLASIYSVRPTISATISIPIEWKKLSSIVPTDFNILNVPATVKKARDPWKSALEEKQDINEILKKH
ncbi:MAG TPA: DNA ligase D [Candidatus Bathyarchaeia archaeon]|nr:DNA ligase D [Candidatus Bathyarchaeia archaeon]